MVVNVKPTLHFVAGKLASGKTTLARRLANECDAILVSEDVWMRRLFQTPIADFRDYLDRSARFRDTIGPHVRELLRHGLSVVFDFGGNVPQERAWVRSLAETTTAEVVLHYLQASDELCKRQLQRRNQELPEGAQPTTDEEFDEITRYFVPPSPDEGFELRHYDASELARSSVAPSNSGRRRTRN